MTTLTFDNVPVPARRPAKRRAVRRALPATDIPLALSAPVVDPTQIRSRKAPIALVAAIVALHGFAIVALSSGTRTAAPPQPAPITIAFAVPLVTPPPPPPPPKVEPPPPPRVRAVVPPRALVAPPPAPHLPAVANDAPLVAATPDTVQVAQPAAAPSAPPPVDEPVTEARGFAGYLNNPAPEYPLSAQRRGIAGQVILKVRVLASGKPDSVAIAKSSGHQVLDEAALKAVQQWTFVPAKRGNTPIDGWVQVPLNFKI